MRKATLDDKLNILLAADVIAAVSFGRWQHSFWAGLTLYMLLWVYGISNSLKS